jgi:cytochrome b involved in lipid metabolism
MDNNKKSLLYVVGAIVVVVLIVWGMNRSGGNTNTMVKDTTNTTNTQQTENQVSSSTTTMKYMMVDVAKHATAADCWVTVEGKIYDITKLIPTHSGGPAISGLCGKDATTAFNTRAGNGPHPAEAKMDLQTYFVSDLSK